MLAKVKGVQWCSNAAKLHDNELSSSFSPLRIKEKYHLHEDKRNRSRVIVPSEAIQSDQNNCTATITCSFNIINVFLLFFRGLTYIWAAHSQMLVFRADSWKYQSSLLRRLPWKKCPPTICRDQYLWESWKLDGSLPLFYINVWMHLF